MIDAQNFVEIENKVGHLPAMLSQAEMHELARLGERTKANGQIVEIGSWKGMSSCWLSLGAALGSQANLFCIDTWVRPWTLWGQIRDGRKTREELGSKNTLPGFLEAIETAGVTESITVCPGTSAEIATQWKNGIIGNGSPINGLFFDASKNYKTILEDLQNWIPHVESGSWVAWHDNDDPRMRQFLDDHVMPDRALSLFTNVYEVHRLTIAELK